MTYLPQKISITSSVGVNSDTVISGGNWVSNTYTGTGEENDYAYVGCNLQVDEAGTLYFDFSQDGTNWSTFPVAGFTVASGINEVHTAWKGGRYMRPRFVGVGGRSYFRLETYYSNLSLPLSSPLNQSIGSDQDASIVRAVGIGETPTGTYVNVPADGLGFSTTTLLTNGQTYDSGVLNISRYTQVQTDILSDKNGTLIFDFSSDSAGADIVRSVTIPYVGGSGFKFFSAPAFTPYVRYRFTCNEVGQSDFYFDTKFTTKSISGQILGMEDFISSSMVANLGRSVIVGKEASGAYENVTLTETSNADGLQHNLNVVSGARPSQISGRTSVRIVIDGITANTLLRTNTGTLNVYITDILLSVENSSTTLSGVIKFRDGITATGSVVLPLLIAEAPTSETAVSQITHNFQEPLLFADGVYLEEGDGVNTVSGVILGYEE